MRIAHPQEVRNVFIDSLMLIRVCESNNTIKPATQAVPTAKSE